MSKSLSVILGLFVLFLAIGAPQCATEEFVSIDAPSGGGEVLTEPPDLVVSFGIRTVPFRWKALLNGGSVFTFFEPQQNATAIAPGSRIADRLLEGTNRLRVNWAGDTDEVEFLYDAFGPAARLRTLSDEGNTMHLTGVANDFSGVSSVRVNGVSAALSGNDFEVTVPASDLLTFDTEDTLGNARSETFASETIFLPESAAGRVTQAGFDLLAEKVTTQFEGLVDLEALLIAANPLFEQTLPGASTRVDVESLSYETFSLVPDLVPPQGMAWLANYEGILMTMRATGDVLGTPYDTIVTATSDRLEALVHLTAAVVENQIRITIDEVNIDFVNLVIDYGDLPEVFQETLGAAITNAIDDELTSQLESVLPVLLTELLESLSLGGVVEVNGAYLTFAGQPNRITIDEAAMNLYLGGNVTPNEKSESVPFFPGSRYTPSLAPDMSGITAPARMGVTMSDDMLNRLLFAGYETGKLTSEVETTLQEVAANTTPFGLLDNRSQEIADIPIRAVPRLHEQPWLRFQDGRAIFEVTDLETEFFMFQDTPASWRSIITLLINIRVPANFAATPEGKLNVSFADRPSVTFRIVEESFLRPADNVDTNALIEAILPLILEEFGKTMEEVPLPAFEDYEFHIDTLTFDGPAQDYITLVGNLQERTTPQE